jgi:signal transduction histidine kinase/PleD family two-component response regulator
MTDPYSDVVLINPAARRLLGIDESGEVVTRQYLQDRLGFYPFDLVATRPVAAPAAGPGASGSHGLVREELRIGDKVLHSIVSPVRDAAGKLVGVVVVLRDITEATELARRKDEFVSVVSHELRTPLTSVTGALDIVLKEYVGPVTEKQRRYLQMARDSCARLNVVVDDLLDVARSERGKMPMRFHPILLDEVARDAVDRYRPPAEAKSVDLQVAAADRAIRIIGDPDRLTQVLNNLLSNAIKFTPDGGRIDVEIFGPSVAANHVGVSVYNNGEAIPEHARERVFDKFEQIQESATRRVGGTGLGLAISRAIIEAHGGRIWVEPRLEGTKFVFTLPAAPSAEEKVNDRSDIDLSRIAAVAESGSTILLVGDDRHTSIILKGILMASGHEVPVARDIDQALTLARQHRPALVAVDVSSIADDPYTLIEILKHDPDTRKAAILGVGPPEQRDAVVSAGAADMVTMPIHAATFRDTCHRLIAEAGQGLAARILIVDDDAGIRMICREVLENAGYLVREAQSGQAALTEAKRFRPDLLLLDVMMPQMDGFQTAQRFRADSATTLMPIIFLSARGETADKVQAFRIGAEDYIVKPFDAAELMARVAKALERRDRELGASPTTQLPGANAIETEIERRLADGSDYAICYLDLDNLKAFNDYYGYAKADGIIRQTGDLIREVIAKQGSPGDFIGHIAGDDFVFITTADRVDQVCSSICTTFDRLIPLYYNRTDRERGYIEATDRYGVQRRFPMMGVSIAVVTPLAGPFASFGSLATAAAEGKKLAKEIGGSAYVRDMRIVSASVPDRGQPVEVVTGT